MTHAAEKDAEMHWPRVADPGVVCSCGRFKIAGVVFAEAQRRWWAHVLDARPIPSANPEPGDPQ